MRDDLEGMRPEEPIEWYMARDGSELEYERVRFHVGGSRSRTKTERPSNDADDPGCAKTQSLL